MVFFVTEPRTGLLEGCLPVFDSVFATVVTVCQRRLGLMVIQSSCFRVGFALNRLSPDVQSYIGSDCGEGDSIVINCRLDAQVYLPLVKNLTGRAIVDRGQTIDRCMETGRWNNIGRCLVFRLSGAPGILNQCDIPHCVQL